MADIIITKKIPSIKVAKALEGYLALYPNKETIPDPAWKGEESETPQIAKYTDEQWFNEKDRRLLIRDIKRGLQMIANEEAQIEEDDSLVETV